MSWFDASGFANLAKIALKEAQKTIDKALDIQDEDQKQCPANSSDFFQTWEIENKTISENKPIHSKNEQSSVWGSFSGSFFENPNDNAVPTISNYNLPFKKSVDNMDKLQTFFVSSTNLSENLSDNITNKNFRENPIIETIEEEKNESIKSQSTNFEEVVRKVSTVDNHLEKEAIFDLQEPLLESENINTSTIPQVNQITKTEINETINRDSVLSNEEEKSVGYSKNLLSVLSIENHNKSSESIENLNSQSYISTDCTNYTDSAVNSFITIIDAKGTSDTVKMLQDSSILQSSMEVLGDWKRNTSPHILQMDEKLFESSLTPTPTELMDMSLYNESSVDGDDNKSSTSTLEGSQKAFIKLDLESSAHNKEMYCSTSNLASPESGNIVTDPANENYSQSSMQISESQLIDQLDNADSIEMFSMTRSLCNQLESSTIEPLDDSKKLHQSLTEFCSVKNLPVHHSAIKRSCSDQKINTSCYVKNMLADAMVEKAEAVEAEKNLVAEMPRENSPISSESRSEFLKIGSDQTSSHTSGDELETATSSDIEIISSPNGDSSSTQSRQSPTKFQACKSLDLLTKTLKSRGHAHELNELNIGSVDAILEIDRLLKRIMEMTDILEARESKLIEVSRANVELFEQNANLKQQLKNSEKNTECNQNIVQITDEYTQRLSAFEWKFQQAIRERDLLRMNLESLKQEATNRLTSTEMFSIINEKDKIIKELREEGEKLSKQQLQHSNIIKKLRIKEKENDALIKNQKELLSAKEKFIREEEELRIASENTEETFQLLAQVEDLKIKLRQAEESHIKKEEMLKQENLELLKRLEVFESRNEEMSEAVSQATKPLLRQIEQMQSNLLQKTNFTLKQEKLMNEKVADLQIKLESTVEMNRSINTENTNLRSKCSVLESKINTKETEWKTIDMINKTLKEKNKNLLIENESHKQAMNMMKETYENEIKVLKKKIISLDKKLSKASAIDVDKSKASQMVLTEKSSDDKEHQYPSSDIERDSIISTNNISASFDNESLGSNSDSLLNLYETFQSGLNNTSIIESLQAQLKQRDGEVQQLQWELSRRNTERKALNDEVSILTSKMEDLNTMVTEVEMIKENLNDVQTKYDALLQMYGEKVEENEELRLDLADVKEMYKTQIDHLLQKDL